MNLVRICFHFFSFHLNILIFFYRLGPCQHTSLIILAYLSLISIWQIILRYFKIFRKYYEGGIPMCNYLFKDNNGDTRAIWKICSKLTKKTTGWHRSHYFGVFVNLVIWWWLLWCFHYWFWTSKYWLGFWGKIVMENDLDSLFLLWKTI